jgi:hypothetical protein
LSWTGCIKSIPFNRDPLIGEVNKHLSDRCRQLWGLRSRSKSNKDHQDTNSETDNDVSHEIFSPSIFSLALVFPN